MLVNDILFFLEDCAQSKALLYIHIIGGLGLSLTAHTQSSCSTLSAWQGCFDSWQLTLEVQLTLGARSSYFWL